MDCAMRNHKTMKHFLTKDNSVMTTMTASRRWGGLSCEPGFCHILHWVPYSPIGSCKIHDAKIDLPLPARKQLSNGRAEPSACGLRPTMQMSRRTLGLLESQTLLAHEGELRGEATS